MGDTMKLGRDLDVQIRVDCYEVRGRTPGDITGLIAAVGSNQHIDYSIAVNCRGQEWRFTTRFSAIDAVYKVLCDRFPHVPPLPPKTLVRHFDHIHIEERKHSLNQFFAAVCKRNDLLNCPEFASFLRLPENAVEFQSGASTEPLKVAKLEEMTFGVQDFFYDMENGYLLVGSCDPSIKSKLDYAMGNFKLPWDIGTDSSMISRMSMWKQCSVALKFDLLWTCNYTAPLTKVAYSRGTGYAFCALANGSIGFKPKNQDITKNTLPLLQHTDVVTALAFDEETNWLFSTSKDRRVNAYDVKNERILTDITSAQPVHMLALDGLGRRVYGGTRTGQIYCWDITTLSLQLVATITVPHIRSMHLAPNAFENPTLFLGSGEGITVVLLKNTLGLSSGRVYSQIVTRHVPMSITFAESSREVIAGNKDGTVSVFDIDNGRATFVFRAHRDAVTSVMFLDAPRRLITAGKDKCVRFWDFPSMKRMSLLTEVASSEGEERSARIRRHTLEDLACSSPRLPLSSAPAAFTGGRRHTEQKPFASQFTEPQASDAMQETPIAPPPQSDSCAYTSSRGSADHSVLSDTPPAKCIPQTEVFREEPNSYSSLSSTKLGRVPNEIGHARRTNNCSPDMDVASTNTRDALSNVLSAACYHMDESDDDDNLTGWHK